MAVKPSNFGSEAEDRFVEAWGRMGSVWGISRTMAEVHALLYITGAPHCTDDVMSRLEISRGNASMSLRALLDWGVIARIHRRGDRKEYYQAEQDVWAIFRAIVRERMKREVDPLLVNLHEIRDHTRSGDSAPEIDTRLDEMIGFLETGTRLAEQFTGPRGPGLRLAATLLSKTPLGKGKPGPSEATTDERSDAI
ncbi:MAG: transcriptional regulator [Planctomycetota bacterium]